ncbi:MAG: hypothetical protein A2599_02335 [Candidatus Staskawiczbacteria bacterium RIFOXYD1_FULL_39_28]|uniref:Type II secretion system protein GspG C-terminal domain-containing protein n=1 Tax=Candidatus Staskawiczbacteria bacterium RIFOXYC1_FULL_38_18 TaxID=1802229 RepID=A0A1G2JAN4_9BACT|nr:MAG: hypothetical protein A2401_01945 [Candidatus Staskawiczbacteria bacterium RIFOXYC1_FULL_38_18]OGZ89916.1 MAG: hypothetical protein A2599_02335 [Candidatus Staskawiczbacteria bacterium RIFOXYD1_FULL_39_28]
MSEKSIQNKGFTLIELIVVIVVIVILAAVVVTNVVPYINKGDNSAIKANMTTIKTIAVIYNGQQGGKYYVDESQNLTEYPDYLTAVAAIAKINSAPMLVGANETSPNAYCLWAQLKGEASWCIDSTGYVGTLAEGKCADTTYTCQ